MRKTRSRTLTGLAAASVATVALLAAGCSSSSGGGSSSGGSSSSGGGSSGSGNSPAAAGSPAAHGGGSTLDTTTISGTSVVTNSKGFTLYWFVPDTSTKSNCNGACAHFWPPVKGPATAGTGATGKIGVITRSDGSKQATYDGHPLYTYIGDSAPGQAKGNGLNLEGGVWHEVTASGATAPSGQNGGSGGTGY